MGHLKKRRKRAIIRYYRGKYDDDEIRIRSLMLLFYPFRDEKMEVHENSDIVQKYNRLKENVHTNQRQFEPNPDFMNVLENVNTHEINSEDVDEDAYRYAEEETTTAEEIEDFMEDIMEDDNDIGKDED